MNATDLTGQKSRSRLKLAPHSKYRILALIGQGQYGRVFCGLDRSTGQIVALKELSHHRSPTNIFLRELWSLITLEHPNIVTCQALEHTATGRFLVMDYCEGGTLRQLLEQDSALRLAEGLQLIVGILAGLDYIHQRGIVHCDIKPENILLTLAGNGWVPRLSDFGIALRVPNAKTPTSNSTPFIDATMGSPGYMAPERFYGLYSPASDIYAVGIILYELLTGDRPFHGVPGKLMWAHLNQRLQLPSHIPEPLRVIVQKSLEKLTARRFAGATEMAKALKQAMDDPAVKQLSDRLIPWENNPESVSPNPILESEPKILPAWTKWRELANLEAREPRFPLLDALFPLPYKAAVEPDRRWLAVATANELHFYSLLQLQNAAQSQALSPLRKLPFSETTLPELIFLDRRHLLAIWSDRQNNQTLLRSYNRRGHQLSSHSLPIIFRSDPNGRSLIRADEPYTLLGVSSHPKPAVFRIQLLPLQVSFTPVIVVS